MDKEKGEKRHLSGFAILIWGAKIMSAIAGFGAVFTYLFYSLGYSVLFIAHDDIPDYGTAISGVLFFAYFLYQVIRYRNHFYILADDEAIIRWGVLDSQREIIPYVKIQNVNISNDVVQRLLGIGTLKIETASKSPGEVMLPYLPDCEKIHDEIIERMLAAKRKGKIDIV